MRKLQTASLVLHSEAGRTLPHSVEAEQGTLGSMLVSPRDTIGEAIEQISEEYFYIPAHQTIYSVLVEQWNSKVIGIDLITFTQTMRDKNLLDSVGGVAFVTSLFTFVPTAANMAYYLSILRDKYILRQIIAAGTESVRRAYEEQDEAMPLLDAIEGKVMAIRDERKQGDSGATMKEDVMASLEGIERLWESKGAVTGIETGFHDLDEMTSGLQDGDMIVIAARPSQGKTAMAMNIAEHVAIKNKQAVAVFSLEMSRQQLVQRMLCSQARVNIRQVRKGVLSERDFPALTSAAAKLAEAPLYILDPSSITILELRAKARRLKSQHDIKLVVIDYLQLLKGSLKRSQENRQLEISEISAGIKALAKELHIPIIVLAQLNRQPEARYGGKPRLSDLRESGSVEQDADVVALLVRPEIYADNDEDRFDLAGEAELIIAKQRNGPVGEIKLTFIKEITKFETRARMALSNE